jgi:pimeloyl-ACP methyl ester carboxylesterase
LSDEETPRFAPLPDGARLDYRELGPADAPVILLNRPLGGSMALWGDFARTLAKDHRVLAFDPRGVGLSSDVPLFFGTRDMAKDAILLLDHLRIERAHVFGLSLGGMVASWIAADAPERTSRLILASTLPEVGAVSHRALARGLPLARAFASRGSDVEARLVRGILSDEFVARAPERVREIEATVRRAPSTRKNLLALSFAAIRHRIAPVLAEHTPNALLLFGALDAIAGKRSEAELLRDVAHATLHHIPDAGHDVTLEQPEVTARRVLDFLD